MPPHVVNLLIAVDKLYFHVKYRYFSQRRE